MKSKPLVSTVGGKHFLSNWLAEKLTNHKLYIEVFAGGANLLYKKVKSPVEILNDINDDLICFYKVIQDANKRLQLINILNSMPYARRIFKDLSIRWRNSGRPSDEILRASEWYYLSKSCFQSDFNRGGWAAPNANRDTAKTFRNHVASMDFAAERLKNVSFECLNYDVCISKYGGEESFMYVDPPYAGTEFYYKNGCFKESDHYELARLLNNTKSKVILSHYDDPLYDQLYKSWNKGTCESFTGSITKTNKKPKKKTLEVVYTNF